MQTLGLAQETALRAITKLKLLTQVSAFRRNAEGWSLSKHTKLIKVNALDSSTAARESETMQPSQEDYSHHRITRR